MPVCKDDTEQTQRMLFLSGSKTSFRCTCGCNVFTQLSELKYRCNGCAATHTGERDDATKR